MEQLLNSTKAKMDKALEVLVDELGTIRAGRANPALIEQLKIRVYGGSQQLSVAELGTITVADAKTMVITPFDPAIIDEFERGLLEANVGMSVVQDGEIIRLKLPDLTAERREEFIKLCKTKTEGIRVMIRQVRAEAMAEIKKRFDSKEIGEDEKFRFEKEIQKLTDQTTETANNRLESKTKELQTI